LDLLPGEREDQIECAIRVVSLPSANDYEALSYVWGDPSGSISIKVQNEEVKVNTNLHVKLPRN